MSRSRGVKALVLVSAAVAAGLAAASCASGPAAAGRAPYYLVFLRPDPARTALSVEGRRHIQAAHMANIQKLADEGVMAAAGPMDDRTLSISGIFVFRAPSADEARRVAALDPTVVARRNTVDAHAWWGPAGIGDFYFTWRRDHPGAGVDMAVHAFCMVSRGPAWKEGEQVPEEHENFIESLHASGMLAAAGRIDGDPELVEVVIFKTPSIADARTVMEGDPMVRSGLLSIEYHRWWTADRVLPW